MNKIRNVNFDKELIEARNNFKLLGVYFEEVIYSAEIVLEANGAAKMINGTVEANVLNVIRYSMRKNAILSLRKLFEKSGKDKKSNIDSLINFIKKYKKELAAAYFKAVFQDNSKATQKELVDPDTKNIKIINLNKKEQKRYRLEYFQEAEKEYLEIIDKLYIEWNDYFVPENFKSLIDNRTVLAHSMGMDKAMEFEGLSFDSIKEYLDKAADFMNSIDMLINRNKTNYETFYSAWKNAAQEFWKRLN